MTPAPPTPESAYRGLRARSVAQEQKLDRLGLVLANLRLALFLGALAVAGLSFWGKLPGWTKGLAAGLASGFVAAAVAHDRVLARQARAKERILVNERGLARIEGRFSELPERGDAHLEPEHPYARDLDVFGPASLFQLLDATGTRFSIGPRARGPRDPCSSVWRRWRCRRSRWRSISWAASRSSQRRPGSPGSWRSSRSSRSPRAPARRSSRASVARVSGCSTGERGSLRWSTSASRQGALG